MNYIIVAFGCLIAFMGGLLAIKPSLVMDPLHKYADSLWLHATAVVVRLVLGVALVLYAPLSKFPIVLEVIGWLAITAALVLWAMGRENFQALMSWALGFTSAYSRIGGWLTVLFGSFLVYAVI